MTTSAPVCSGMDLYYGRNAGNICIMLAPHNLTARGNSMDPKSAPHSRSRRDFLATTSLLAAAVAAPKTASGLTRDALSDAEQPASAGTLRKIPIGVFDPAFPNLSTDEMIDKFA